MSVIDLIEMEHSCPHLVNANLTKDLQGRLIYKDECTRCFDSAKTPYGVDVCLRCFNGACASPERNHTELHFGMTQHPIVMNIKMVEKDMTD